MDDLADFFKRLDAHAFDPNETVVIDGVRRRVINVYDEGTRQTRCKAKARIHTAAWKAANPDKVAAQRERWKVANPDKVIEQKERWKAANPDKVIEQKKRASDRSYHRPFIAIDAEGQDFPGDDRFDKKGNVYPAHGTTLWGAGGWQRIHTSTELAAGIGLPTLGKECPSCFLGFEDKRMLDPFDIIEWLLGLPERYNEEQGFQHGVNFVSYAFNYDATQIFAGFPRSKVWEITRKKSWKTKKRTKAPTLVDEYAIDYLKSKWLRIWKLRDPENPYKDKLDKNGNVKLKKSGKPEREIDDIAYICIEDAFGFYQSRFTKAIKPLVSQGYVAKKDYDEIEKMKERRGEFEHLPFEKIKHYCNRELVCLSKALTVLRDGFDEMEIKLRAWTGAGSPAGALIRKEELKEKHYSPDITVFEENMTPQQNQAHHAMIGGRIEALQQGAACERGSRPAGSVTEGQRTAVTGRAVTRGTSRRELFLYDIVSAYPSAMLLLPSMKGGRWVPHDRLVSAQDAINANILSMFRVKWKFPTKSHRDRRGIPFFPFPYRTRRKAILFPNEGHAWIMRDELVAAFKWARRFDCVDGIEVEEWNEFIPASDEVPYAFVQTLYEMRREAKSEKEYNIVEKAIKLALNSLYGKTVQSVGGDEENAPSCACPYYGAAITANCRARLMEAALIDPYSVVAFMTDGIVTTRELEGLPRAKEVFEGEPPVGTIMDLGDWEFERMAGGFFLQSGVYHLSHKSGKTKDKTRGADPRNFILKMPLKDLMLDRVLPEWKKIADYYNLEIEIQNFVTAGSAAVSDERFGLIGRWSDVKRTINIHNMGVKRKMIAEYPEFYYSQAKVKGVIDKRTIERAVEILGGGATSKEVAECYRSGEAFRCRFLVPSLPAKNETPDELSLRAEAQWLNPDYDEDEGAAWELTGQDQDTADVLIGNS